MTAPSPVQPRRLTPRELVLARSALGLSRSPRSFRNLAHENTDDHRVWCGLVAEGLAVCGRKGLSEHYDAFRLTYRGGVLALRPGETLDLKDFPVALGGPAASESREVRV